jgi:hypothetical protein
MTRRIQRQDFVFSPRHPDIPCSTASWRLSVDQNRAILMHHPVRRISISAFVKLFFLSKAGQKVYRNCRTDPLHAGQTLQQHGFFSQPTARRTFMQKRPMVRSTIIALSVAGIIAGTHAGIAAINNEVAANVTEPAAIQTEPQDVAEAQTPAESSATIAQAPVDAQVDRMPSAGVATRDEQYVRIPFTNRSLKVSQSTFPSTGMDTEMLPSVVAYFDRRNASIVLTGAASPVFPGEAADSPSMLPSMVAYFDRAASQTLASARPATDAPVTTLSSASEAPANAVAAVTY